MFKNIEVESSLLIDEETKEKTIGSLRGMF